MLESIFFCCCWLLIFLLLLFCKNATYFILLLLYNVYYLFYMHSPICRFKHISYMSLLNSGNIIYRTHLLSHAKSSSKATINTCDIIALHFFFFTKYNTVWACHSFITIDSYSLYIELSVTISIIYIFHSHTHEKLIYIATIGCHAHPALLC